MSVCMRQGDEPLGSIYLRGCVVTAVEFVPDGEWQLQISFDVKLWNSVPSWEPRWYIAVFPYGVWTFCLCVPGFSVSAKRYDVNGNLFEVITSDEVHYFLQAATAEERKEWIKAIQEVSKWVNGTAAVGVRPTVRLTDFLRLCEWTYIIVLLCEVKTLFNQSMMLFHRTDLMWNYLITKKTMTYMNHQDEWFNAMEIITRYYLKVFQFWIFFS